MEESLAGICNGRILIWMCANNRVINLGRKTTTSLFSKLIFWTHLKSISKITMAVFGFPNSSAYPLPPTFLQLNPPTFQIRTHYPLFFFAVGLCILPLGYLPPQELAMK